MDLGRAGVAGLEHEVVALAVNGARSPVLGALAAKGEIYTTEALAKGEIHVAREEAHTFDPTELIPGVATAHSIGETIDACF